MRKGLLINISRVHLIAPAVVSVPARTVRRTSVGASSLLRPFRLKDPIMFGRSGASGLYLSATTFLDHLHKIYSISRLCTSSWCLQQSPGRNDLLHEEIPVQRVNHF